MLTFSRLYLKVWYALVTCSKQFKSRDTSFHATKLVLLESSLMYFDTETRNGSSDTKLEETRNRMEDSTNETDGVVCWRCSSHGSIQNLLSTNQMQISYASVLVCGATDCNASLFLRDVQGFENYGMMLDSFTGFCDDCMRITMHTVAERAAFNPLHYMQNQIMQLKTLQEFDLLPKRTKKQRVAKK